MPATSLRHAPAAPPRRRAAAAAPTTRRRRRLRRADARLLALITSLSTAVQHCVKQVQTETWSADDCKQKLLETIAHYEGKANFELWLITYDSY